MFAVYDDSAIQIDGTRQKVIASVLEKESGGLNGMANTADSEGRVPD